MKIEKFFIAASLLLLLQMQCMCQHTNFDNNKQAGKYAPVNGIKLYYETYGQGFPLLLLHGNGGNMSAFEKQIPFFSKYYKVIAVDSRLQGKSGGSADTLSYEMMANDFCALMDYLHLKSAYVLGWSDGGINAIMMALQCPDKIKAVAFTGANIFTDSTVFTASDIEGMRAVAESKTASTLDKTLNRMMLYQPNLAFTQLAKIKCPALVIAGDQDIIKPEHTLKIFQSIPGAQLCIFPASNHGVCQQHPPLFNQTVLDFFKKCLDPTEIK